jgi:uncharacterized membrane protein YhfC
MLEKSAFFKDVFISDVLIAYMNMAGVAFMASVLICLGLQWFTGKKYFAKYKIFGLGLCIFSVFFLMRSIVLAFIER